MHETVNVNLPGRAYDVLIGTGLLAEAGTHIAPLLKRSRVVIISDENVAALHLDSLQDGLRASGIDISGSSLFRWVISEGWNTRARTRTVPMLTEAHRAARLKWATEQLQNDWVAHVDLDEKWWYSVALNRKHKLPDGVPAHLFLLGRDRRRRRKLRQPSPS